MEIKREIVTSVFDEILPIEAGRANLTINNGEASIYVSGVFNPSFFDELLSLVQKIKISFTKDKEYYDYSYLYFDEEGSESQIHFMIPIWSYDDYITVDIDQKWGNEDLDFVYQIKKTDLLKNIIGLIEHNIEAYNKDAEDNSYEHKWEFYYNYFQSLDLNKFLSIKEDIIKLS